MRAALVGWLVLCACGGSSGGGGDGGGGGDDVQPMPDGSAGNPTLRERQRKLAMDLRGSPRFMIGVGNDNQGPYTHAVPIDLHYVYLVGYGDNGGWPTWNAQGDYPLLFAQNAASHQTTPMYTYYQLALELEQNNDAVLNDTTRMHQYLSDVTLLFQKIAANGKPAAAQFEPDFFGYLMQRAAMGKPPSAIPAKVHHADIPQCASLPETAEGLTRCIIAIGRAISPTTKIGFH